MIDFLQGDVFDNIKKLEVKKPLPIKKINSSTSYGVNDVLVFWQGLCLEPSTDYAISGTTLTFDQSVKAGDHIVVRYLPVSG